MFYQSLVSDWNNPTAHFLRGVVTELKSRGHEVNVYEQDGNAPVTELTNAHGMKAVKEFYSFYPDLSTNFYNSEKLNADTLLKEADLVLVQDKTELEIIKKLIKARKKGKFKLLFHDTGHKVVTDKQFIESIDLSLFDGVVAYGEVIKNIYLIEGWARRAWVWHEGVDTRMFYPRGSKTQDADAVWIGNWSEDRAMEIYEYLINPVKELKIKARVYGVNYPKQVLAAMKEAGIEYCGWLPNYRVPETLAKHRVAIHIPRRPYVQFLPGIPTIRPYEAMACGIPLISAPWSDCENLFSPGKDFLVARTGKQMVLHLAAVLNTSISEALTISSMRTINKNHSCYQRVNDLEKICEDLEISKSKIYNMAEVEAGR